MKNVPTLHAVCRRGYCVFPAVAAPFGFRALSGCRPVYLLGVGHYDFQSGFPVGDHSSGSRGDGDRHVRLFGDLQRRNRCRGTRRGFVCTHASIARIGYAGGAIALLAALFCLVRLVPLLKRSGADFERRTGNALPSERWQGAVSFGVPTGAVGSAV